MCTSQAGKVLWPYPGTEKWWKLVLSLALAFLMWVNVKFVYRPGNRVQKCQGRRGWKGWHKTVSRLRGRWLAEVGGKSHVEHLKQLRQTETGNRKSILLIVATTKIFLRLHASWSWVETWGLWTHTHTLTHICLWRYMLYDTSTHHKIITNIHHKQPLSTYRNCFFLSLEVTVEDF